MLRCARLIGRAVLVLAALGCPLSAIAETVERGDTLSITILEEPKLGREAKINADGRIMLPLLGGIDAAGSTVDEIRTRIEQGLTSRDIIRTPTVVVEVSVYRSVYVGGTVANPGAVSFEPGLTVRHVLVLAGGLDRTADGALVTADGLGALRTEWRAKTYQLDQTDSLVRRLSAELDRKTGPDGTPVEAQFVNRGETGPISSLDAGMLDDRLKEWQADQDHLHDALALVDLEIDVLTKQTVLQESESKSQQAEVESTRTLVERGLVPLPRLQELERQASRLSRDLLEGQAFIARARQERATKEYELATADSKWRIAVGRDLRDAMLQRAKLESELDMLGGKMLSAGLSLRADGTLMQPEAAVVIHRGAETIPASMETPIEPGDVVEVSLAQTPGG